MNMKKLIILGVCIFIISIGIGFIVSSKIDSNTTNNNDTKKSITEEEIAFLDGYYETEIMHGEPIAIRHFLRFYEDGTVIFTYGNAYETTLKDWFNKENNNESILILKGTYKIKGKGGISFEVSNPNHLSLFSYRRSYK